MGDEDDDVQYTLSWSRYIIYIYTSALIGGGCYLFGTFPAYSGISYFLTVFLGLTCALILYVYIPFQVQKESLSPLLIKGRSFLSLYHVALVLSVPLFIIFYLSFGRLNSLKSEVRDIDVASIQNEKFPVATVLKLSDGFVAVNSSISIVTSLSKHPMPVYDSLYFEFPVTSSESYLRQVPSVYYAEVKVLQSPFDDFPLTRVREVHEDARDQVTVAPIFAKENACLHRFPPVHITCALENKVLGFALVNDRSLCRDLAGVTICREHVSLNTVDTGKTVEVPLTLQPKYDCDANAGLCGRMGSTPSNQLFDEIVKRARANGWTIEQSEPLLWLEVNDLTECELNRDFCVQQYTKVTYAAVGLLGLVQICIFAALLLDFYVDLLVSRLANDYKYRQVAKINTLYTS